MHAAHILLLPVNVTMSYVERTVFVSTVLYTVSTVGCQSDTKVFCKHFRKMLNLIYEREKIPRASVAECPPYSFPSISITHKST